MALFTLLLLRAVASRPPLSAGRLGSIDDKPLMSYEGNWVASKRFPGSGHENGVWRFYFPGTHVLL